MAEHHHRHHHHHGEEEQPAATGYGYGQPYPSYGEDYQQPGGYPYGPGAEQSPYLSPPPEAAYGLRPNFPEQEYPAQESRLGSYEAERRDEKKKEHYGEAAALASGVFAMYEAHEVKADPEHARRHKVEEEIALAAAAGGTGTALYEHHEVKKTQRLEEEVEGKKHHHRHHLF